MLLPAARKLDLLPKTLRPSSSSAAASPPAITSLLYDPSSRSLVLMLSDSSTILYPSFSPFSPSPPPTFIPSPSSAACFLRLLSRRPSAPARLLFLSAAPSPSVLLRAWVLQNANSNPSFAPARLSFKRDLDRSALSLPLRHGLSLRLAATVNALVVHSPAAAQIWILSAKLADVEDTDCKSVRLTRCAVIDCTLPIYSMGLSMGFLLLGETEGVRIFPLRPLIKGESAERKHVSSGIYSRKKKLPNGVVVTGSRGKSGLSAGACRETAGSRVCCCDGEGASRVKTAKLRQNSSDHCSIFVEMRVTEVQNSESITGVLASVKAISIHELSQKSFLILDSIGDVHLLNLHSTVKAPEASCHSFINSEDAHMNRLSYTMKVQILAILPDIAARTQAIWISDGGYSVHMVSMADMESCTNENENEKDGNEENAMQISAIQAIFTSDKVQDVLPLSANTILILGKGNILAYAIA